MVDKVDSEIASVPAPQLVVPLSNARFAINATNARWGSLFDSFYGSDIIPESSGLEKNLSGSGYNAKRGALVIQHTCQILDMICPLTNGSFSRIKDVQIRTGANKNLFVEFLVVDHTTQASSLKDPSLFVGYSGDLVPDAGKRFIDMMNKRMEYEQLLRWLHGIHVIGTPPQVNMAECFSILEKHQRHAFLDHLCRPFSAIHVFFPSRRFLWSLLDPTMPPWSAH